MSPRRLGPLIFSASWASRNRTRLTWYWWDEGIGSFSLSRSNGNSDAVWCIDTVNFRPIKALELTLCRWLDPYWRAERRKA
jgi:hypothetical protein